jgi:hypothetical protein
MGEADLLKVSPLRFAGLLHCRSLLILRYQPIIEHHLNGIVHFGRVAMKPGKREWEIPPNLSTCRSLTHLEIVSYHFRYGHHGRRCGQAGVCLAWQPGIGIGNILPLCLACSTMPRRMAERQDTSAKDLCRGAFPPKIKSLIKNKKADDIGHFSWIPTCHWIRVKNFIEWLFTILSVTDIQSS